MSTPNAPPNYTSLQVLQDTMNESAMKVPVSNTELGQAALTIKKAYFTTANSRTYTDTISPEDRPSKSTVTGGITTILSTEAATGTACIIITAPTIDPFEVQETICQFVQDQ